MDSQRKNKAVLVEGYMHVDRSGSNEEVAKLRDRSISLKPVWRRYYCVMERRVLCMYEESPWISFKAQEMKFFIPITLNSRCGVAARKPGSVKSKKFMFEISSPLSGTFNFYAPSREKGMAWIKTVSDEISRIRTETAKLTFPFRGWIRFAAQGVSSHFSLNQRVSALPLMTGFAVLKKRKVQIYGLPPSHYTETQQTPRRIIEIYAKLKVKKYSNTSSNDYVFALKTKKESFLFCMSSEVGRQLWMNACDLAIVQCIYPEYSLEQVKLVQFLRSLDLEKYVQPIIASGIDTLESLISCPAAEMNKLMSKCGFTSNDEMVFKEEIRFLRPIQKTKQQKKKPLSSKGKSTDRVIKTKRAASVKERLMSHEIVGRYPLSLKFRDSKAQKKKKTLLYAWGERDLLGLGDGDDGALSAICEPTQVTRMRGRNAPDAVFAGDGFTACITKQGQLFTWGKGPLAVGSETIEFRSSPHPVRGLPKAKVNFASCGSTHMTCVTQFGDLYAWGKGEYGQLGLGECRETAVPILVPQVGSLYNDEVVAVSCGSRHTLVLTNEGFVFAMGEASNCKLGNCDPTHNKDSPDWLDTLGDCVTAQIAAADEFSCSVSLDGRCFIWGKITEDLTIPAPKEIEQFDTRIIRHVCCNSHMAAFLVGSSQDPKGASVYTLGEMPNKSMNYLLGHESDTPESKPRLVENLEGHNVVDVSLGNTHFSALCEDGRILLWGNGDRGQLGIGTTGAVATPHEAFYIAGYSYKWVVCGTGMTCAILEETGEHDSSEGVGEVIVPNNPAPVRMLRDSIDPKKLLEESGIMELVGRMPPRNSGRGERD